MTVVSNRGVLCAATLALALAPQMAGAQSRVVTNPKPLAIQRTTPAPQAVAPHPVKGKNGKLMLMASPPATPVVSAQTPGEKRLDLDVVYTDNKIYNPNTGVYDAVHLRSYTGTDVDPNAPFVAPTIEVVPGDTVRMNLHNMLPADDPSCPKVVTDMDIPHCFNSTNMHSHGLWVSPSGNSDNVLIDIKPTVTFQYEYNIPLDHPAGTFWYHPHEHGSTALQVASGMAGALIIRGNRLPTPATHGDIDTLLKTASGAPMTERVLVLQQVQYACVDKSNGRIKVEYKKDASGNYVTDSKGNYIVTSWVCDAGDTGTIEFYEDKTPSGVPFNGPYGFGPGNWAASSRFTSINGLVLPTFKAVAGDIERWRMIHAGIRDTISLQFYKMKTNAPSTDHLLAANESAFISANCQGDPIPYHLIAQDGLTMGQAQGTNVTTLQPGYRADALVVFPAAGNYCVVNAQVIAGASVSRAPVTPRLLGVVTASGPVQIGNIDSYLTEHLIAAAERTMPASVRATVVGDLKKGLLLTSFTPHPDVADSELSPDKQYLTFFIDTSGPTKFEVSTDPFEVPYNPNTPFNPKPYDPLRIDRHLVLGTAQEWDMQSRFASHPYHIHVNPFQIVKILDPKGKDVSGPDAVDDFGGAVDPQYRGMKGVWKDTIWIKNVGNVPTGAYTIYIRTRYQRYIGEFVLHCHILDHEDQGMMENVAVEIPGTMDDMAMPR